MMSSHTRSTVDTLCLNKKGWSKKRRTVARCPPVNKASHLPPLSLLPPLSNSNPPSILQVDFLQLQMNTLRRYKRHYKLQLKPGTNKIQLVEVSLCVLYSRVLDSTTSQSKDSVKKVELELRSMCRACIMVVSLSELWMGWLHMQT